jgi:hypothetical protein
MEVWRSVSVMSSALVTVRTVLWDLVWWDLRALGRR